MRIEYELHGSTAAVLVGDHADTLASSRAGQIELTFAGVTGDKHAGITILSGGRTPFYPRGTEIRNYRQVSIVSVEELAEIAEAMGVPEIKPEWLGANLLIGEIPNLTALPPFTRLLFQNGAVLVVQRDNEPCVGPGKIIAREYYRPELEKMFTPCAKGRRGLTACVEHPGAIRSGEEVKALIPAQTIYSPEK